MTPGTTRSVPYHRFGKAGARPKVYMQAAIHANELPGAMALHHLMPMLVEADRKGLIKGEIVIVPTVNPDHVTPHSEAFQAVVWHLLVSHPKLKARPTKWESVR